MENNFEANEQKIKELLASSSNKNYVFNLLMQWLKEPIYFFTRRMLLNHEDADDATQNTFLKVWTHLDAFKNESKISTWVYSIASNEALMLLRKRKIRAMLSLSSLEQTLSKNLTADSYFNGDEAEAKFQKAVLKLPEKQRLVFNLKYFDNLPYAEISAITGVSEGGLKANFHHAKTKIEQLINQSL
ncbi:MAG: RNA polymerase sigma factor [Luteibaculaceae bacterium]